MNKKEEYKAILREALKDVDGVIANSIEPANYMGNTYNRRQLLRAAKELGYMVMRYRDSNCYVPAAHGNSTVITK